MMIDKMEQFRDHTLSEENKLVVDEIKLQTFNIANVLENNLYDSEEKFIALNKLKEASMWATVCISMYGAKK